MLGVQTDQAMADVFDPEVQIKDLRARIVAALDRLAGLSRTLYGDRARENGLSPLQMQILLFLRYHEESITVSGLARQFQLTRPTVSDAVKTLESKGVIERKPDEQDGRSHSLVLSEEGGRLVIDLEGSMDPIYEATGALKSQECNDLYEKLTSLITGLSARGFLHTDRMCIGCRFYEELSKDRFHCHLLDSKMDRWQLRLDCAEWQPGDQN